VIFYLISQMVGGGALIGLLFGLDYRTSVAIVGDTGDSLYCPRRHVGHDLDSDHQSVPAARRDERSGLHGHDGVQIQSGGPIRQLGRSSSADSSIMSPDGLLTDPLSTVSLGLALMFGVAGLAHVLMRLFSVANAEQRVSRSSTQLDS
jgi:cation/acetate symporter